MSAQQVSVALVEDHTLFRNMMADMINGIEGYEVVVQAAHGRDYIQLSHGKHVDLAVVDLHMPVMDGFETIRWIRQNQPATRALALTFEKTEEAMVRALRAGACGFLLKDVGKQVFQRAMQQAVILGHFHDDETRRMLSTASEAALTYEEERAETLSRLTDREIEFLRHVCHEGDHTYQQIAEFMKVTERTIHGYRESLFGKLNVKSKAGLVILAFKWGIARVGAEGAAS